MIGKSTATGAQLSGSNVATNESVNWNSIYATMVGNAIANGTNMASAQVDLGTANAQNGNGIDSIRDSILVTYRCRIERSHIGNVGRWWIGEWCR